MYFVEEVECDCFEERDYKSQFQGVHGRQRANELESCLNHLHN
jgi:hypothetical protein